MEDGRDATRTDGRPDGRTKNIVMEEKIECSGRVGRDGKGRRFGFSSVCSSYGFELKMGLNSRCSV